MTPTRIFITYCKEVGIMPYISNLANCYMFRLPPETNHTTPSGLFSEDLNYIVKYQGWTYSDQMVASFLLFSYVSEKVLDNYSDDTLDFIKDKMDEFTSWVKGNVCLNITFSEGDVIEDMYGLKYTFLDYDLVKNTILVKDEYETRICRPYNVIAVNGKKVKLEFEMSGKS